VYPNYGTKEIIYKNILTNKYDKYNESKQFFSFEK